MLLKDILITTTDGFPLAATQYNPSTPKAVLVIAAGLGIPRQFYRHLASYAATRNYQVITFDYRGINNSQNVNFKGRDHRFSQWGQKDLHAVLAYAKEKSDLPILYLAHSAGGQILGLSSYASDVKAASFIGSVIPDPKNYSGVFNKSKLKLLWWVILPLLSLFGDRVHASKIGLSTIDVPTGVIREWSGWGRKKRYLFDKKFKLDLSHYAQVTCPLKIIAIKDDELASIAACFDLASEYPNANRIDQIVNPHDYDIAKLGHFGYFRKYAEFLWTELFDWYDEQL